MIMKVINQKVYKIVSANMACQYTTGAPISTPINRPDSHSKDKRAIEDLFECIRSAQYKDYPSRKTALFVLPFDKAFVSKWLTLDHPHDNYNYALLTLELTGDLIWCDEDLFTKAGIPCIRQVDRQKYANDYWCQASDFYTSFEMPEGLFSGTAKVCKIEYDSHIAK